MNFRSVLRRFVAKNTREAATSTGQVYTGLAQIDSDEDQWRSLSQNARDVSPLTLQRQRDLAYYLADTNPWAHRVVEMKKDFIVGNPEEWTIESPNDQVKYWLNKHWKDKYNQWPRRLESRIKEIGLTGEQCYTATTGTDGIVRLAYVDPGFIKAVRVDKDNFEQPTEIVLKSEDPSSGKDRLLKVIRYDLGRMRWVGIAEDDPPGKYEGQCFFFATNKPIRAKRGRSDLFPMADFFDMLDRFHWNRAERSALINAFVWHWKLAGATQEELEAFKKAQTAPTPGSSFYTNDKASVEAVTPNLQAADAAEEGKMLRSPITTGSGFPQHWLFGEGENANRASAYEMHDPPMRMLASRLFFFKCILYVIFEFQLDELQELGMLTLDENEDNTFSVNTPEISSRDTAKSSTTLKTVGDSLVTAVGLLISRETAIELYCFVASMLGKKIDADEEKKRLAKEQDDIDAEDFEGLDLDSEEGDSPGIENENADLVSA
jgi:hypothetical protein